jgi:hypothetical protein
MPRSLLANVSGYTGHPLLCQHTRTSFQLAYRSPFRSGVHTGRSLAGWQDPRRDDLGTAPPIFQPYNLSSNDRGHCWLGWVSPWPPLCTLPGGRGFDSSSESRRALTLRRGSPRHGASLPVGRARERAAPAACQWAALPVAHGASGPLGGHRELLPLLMPAG